MKSFDRKDILTVVTAEDAKQYIGKEGYFGDSLLGIRTRVTAGNKYELTAIAAEENALCTYKSTDGNNYALFLPADKVKEVEEEKKYRPFKDIAEFLTQYKMGDFIQLKIKPKDIEIENDGGEISGLFVGYRSYIDENAMYVLIGGIYFQLNNIDEMNTLQIKNSNNEWQPFGVLEE